MEAPWNGFVKLYIAYFILITLWMPFTMGSEFNTTKSVRRYPYVLPKCCSSTSSPYQGKNSREFRSEDAGIDPCHKEGSEIVVLPRKFFPGMSADLEYVEVELVNLVHGLECKEGAEEKLLIDLNTVEEDLTTVKIGSLLAYEEYAFSGDNFLAFERILAPQDFCVSSSTKNKERLDLKTCKERSTSSETPIPRCCRGYQSILTTSPKSSLEEDKYEYCSTPKLNRLGREDWNPGRSQILELDNSTSFYQTRGLAGYPNCRLIYLRQSSMVDGDKALTLLSDGKLQLKFWNKTEVLEDFCVDGDFGNEGNETDFGDECQVVGGSGEEVVVVCAPYESTRALQEATALPTNAKTSDFVHLPYCSCGYLHKELTLPGHLFRFYSERNEFHLSSSNKEVVLVRLTTPENNSENFQCPTRLLEERTIEFSEEEIFVADGSLIVDKYVLDSSQFCIRSIYENAVTVRTCKESCGYKKRPCVNRCCSGNNHVNWKSFLELPEEDRFSFQCEPQSSNGTIEWHELPFFKNHGIDIHPEVRKRRPSITIGSCALITTNKYDEPESSIAIPYKMKDGKLLEKVARRTYVKVGLGNYCIEPYMKPSGVTGELLLSGNTDDILVWRCWDDIDSYEEKGYFRMMPELIASLYFTFSLFYLATAGVYIMRSDKAPVFRWSIVSCSCSMMLTYIFFGYAPISFHFHAQADFKYWTPCAVIGMIANFIHLNSFCWITALCFEIWLNLTFVRPGKKNMKLFYLYLAFTFVLPAAFVGTGIILDVIYLNDAFSDVIVPAYGQHRCLFDPDDAALPFFYGPAFLTLINFLFFFHIVIKLWIARHSSAVSQAITTSSRTHLNTFLLYFKLFLIMGLFWIMKAISSMFISLNEPFPLWAIAMEIGAILQPALTFFFFVCNEEMKNYFATKYAAAKHGTWKRICCCLKPTGAPF